jgi:hypothetical protein
MWGPMWGLTTLNVIYRLSPRHLSENSEVCRYMYRMHTHSRVSGSIVTSVSGEIQIKLSSKRMDVWGWKACGGNFLNSCLLCSWPFENMHFYWKSMCKKN